MDDERRGHPSPDREPGQGAWVGSASGPAVTDDGPTPGTDRLAPSLLSTLEGRSPYVTTCPFLRAATDDGGLDVPVEDPDYVNRCAAFGEPKPQSLRQQELACLTSAHAECPRYLRGLVVTHDRLTSVPEARRLSRPILASVGILGLSLGASLAFVLARGGLELPVATGAANGVAGATATPTVGPTLVAQPPSAPPPTPGPTLAPATPEPTPAPTPMPTPPPTPQPTPPPTPEPQPTSDRYQYLEPCPTTPDCWIYVIRYGDALYNLANYFGHSLDTVYRLNPWARNGIQPGDQLILPPPTR